MKLVPAGLVVLMLTASCAMFTQSNDEDQTVWRATVTPVELTTDSFIAELDFDGSIAADTTVTVSVSGTSIAVERAVRDLEGTGVRVTGLAPGTSYRVQVAAGDRVVTSFGFRTFDGDREFQLFTFVEARTPADGTVAVTTFGRLDNNLSLGLRPAAYHTQGEFLNLKGDPQIIRNDNGVLAWDGGTERFSLAAAGSESFFALSYRSDRSFRLTDNHGSQGLLDSSYLMASGEQLLYVPDLYSYHDQGLHHATLIVPAEWDVATVFPVDTCGVADVYLYDSNEGVSAGQLLAFDPALFSSTTQTIDGVAVRVIAENSISPETVSSVHDAYRATSGAWGGGSPGDAAYTVFLVDDDRQIYAGEWTSGQAFSTAFGVTGEMLVHQIYHRWNAWGLGIQWGADSGDDRDRGFWIEGFNEYFCDRVLTELGLTEPHAYMRSFYQQYEAIRGTPADQSLYSTSFSNYTIVYFKGAVYAYALNVWIADQTGGAADLVDVIRALRSDWDQNGTPVNYDTIVATINGFLPGGVDVIDWETTYLVNNAPVSLNL